MIFGKKWNDFSIKFPNECAAVKFFVDLFFLELSITEISRVAAYPEPDGFESKSIILFIGNFERPSDKVMNFDVPLSMFDCGVEVNHFKGLEEFFGE